MFLLSSPATAPPAAPNKADVQPTKQSPSIEDLSKNHFLPFVFLSENVELSNGEKVFITKTVSLDSDDQVYEHELIERLGEEKKIK